MRNMKTEIENPFPDQGYAGPMYFCDREREPDTITLYMDIFSTQNQSEFVALFANTVLGQLDSAPQKAMSRIGKFIKSIRPVFTLDDLSGKPQMMIDVTSANENTSLAEIFDYLVSADRPCYIAIDEFQQVSDYPEKGLEAALRTHIRNLHNVYFIFSGSRRFSERFAAQIPRQRADLPFAGRLYGLRPVYGDLAQRVGVLGLWLSLQK
jgi:hypothetical protein